jgi:importin subunit beta-1
MATVLDLTQALLGGTSHDLTLRQAAEEHLRSVQETNFPAFVVSLAAELANPAKPPDARRMAGILLKNALDAKDEAKRREAHARWAGCDPAIKQGVRDSLLATIASDASYDIRHTAAMALAKVAAVDLPRKEWPGLITALLNNMAAGQPATTRQATLEAMGYVCEEMAQHKQVGSSSMHAGGLCPGCAAHPYAMLLASPPQDVLTPNEINMILTAVVSGMGATEPPESRLAATVALCNAIEFAQHNFENDNERNYLMQVCLQHSRAMGCRGGWVWQQYAWGVGRGAGAGLIHAACLTLAAHTPCYRWFAKAPRRLSFASVWHPLSACTRSQLCTTQSW